MHESFFREAFPSTLEAMGVVLDRAVAALIQRACIPADREPCARLCLEEALVNAVEHGNQADASRHVRLEMTTDGDSCQIRVYDEGDGFLPEKVLDPEPEQMGGRGICLIRHYMKHVEYIAEERCLRMTLPCGSAQTDG